MQGLNEFEQAALDKLLSGDHPILATLRHQVDHARLTSRENTGAGFYCNFEVEDDVPAVQGNFQIGDVQAELEGLREGAGLVLFIRAGRLSMLEGFSYDEPWPAEIRRFSLRYSDPQRTSQLAKLG